MYSGKQVGQEVVKPVEAKISTILEFILPCNKQELRRFLHLSEWVIIKITVPIQLPYLSSYRPCIEG